MQLVAIVVDETDGKWVKWFLQKEASAKEFHKAYKIQFFKPPAILTFSQDMKTGTNLDCVWATYNSVMQTYRVTSLQQKPVKHYEFVQAG